MNARSKTSRQQENDYPGGTKTPTLYRRMGSDPGQLNDTRIATVPGNAQVRPSGATPLIESP
jgi:hypothetical protein